MRGRNSDFTVLKPDFYWEPSGSRWPEAEFSLSRPSIFHDALTACGPRLSSGDQYLEPAKAKIQSRNSDFYWVPSGFRWTEAEFSLSRPSIFYDALPGLSSGDQ